MKNDLSKLNNALPDTAKFNNWLKEWLDNGGNATKAALKSYETDDYSAAGVIGHENLKKLKNAGALYLESKGAGYGKILDVYIKALEAKRIITSPTEPDREIEDHLTRMKAAEHLQALFEDKQQLQFAVQVNNYDITQMKEEELDAIINS